MSYKGSLGERVGVDFRTADCYLPVLATTIKQALMKGSCHRKQLG